MSEALVSTVIAKCVSFILEGIKEEVKLQAGFSKQVNDLNTTLTVLKAVLRDADVKQVSNQAVNLWLQELKLILYDADDVLDEWNTRNFLSQFNPPLVTTTPRITEKMSYSFFSFCSCFKTAALRHEMSPVINEINQRLEKTDRDKAMLNLVASEPQQVLPRRRRATSSLVNVAEIRGRDYDKKIIVDWLKSGSSQEEIRTPVPIFSIVGTAGFGKTTLAQLVFQQEKMNFDLQIWVCVSQPFDLEKVAKEIIEQATKKKATELGGWEALHQQLSDTIKEKKFLIVLDDVWTRNPIDWDPLKLSLDGGAPGSRIIVTTRDERVAEMMRSRIRNLAELSKNECRLLFQQIAFVERSQIEREMLEEIGKKIADKCKGVPLAAKTIASLMRDKKTKIEWRNVLESDLWKFQQRAEGFLPSILLSYDDLDPDLKQCFLYCAIFPKDEIIEKDMLVKLWMGQGFLGLDGDLEKIGGELFDDLAMRSLFQDFTKNEAGNIIKCKMHDLVHDFAQFLTKAECSILKKNDTVSNSEELRHINAGDIDIESLSSFEKVCSLILRDSKQILSELFRQFPRLRSFDFSFSSLEKLPDEVERLLHLRYLDLSETKLAELPETMCNLYNLQTLKLIGCDGLRKLPDGFGRLLNLRHVECQGTSNLSYFPQGFGRIQHLRTLTKFVVSGAKGGCEIGELEDLNLISGGLEISELRQVENIVDAKRAKLQKKENIVSLKLSFNEDSEQEITSENENNVDKHMEDIIGSLRLPNNLEELTIRHYPGLAFPRWMSTMSNIITLHLFKCENCTLLPALGMLTSLEILNIKGCCSIKQVGVEFLGSSEELEIQQQTSFPKLRELVLEMLDEWEGWNMPSSLAQNEILPSLSLLRIRNCPKLKALPATISKLPSLDRLELEGMCGSADIFGISDRCGFVYGESMPSSSSSRSLEPLFPKLTTLTLNKMDEWGEEIHQTTESTISIMPSLRRLFIWNCEKLKVIPNYLFSYTLMELNILHCPKLIEMPSCDLPSLESLKLEGNVGVFSTELTPIIRSNNNHNFKFFRLKESPHSSLPRELNHFKSLQELNIEKCPLIDFNPEEELSKEHFPNLRKLEIKHCGIMTECCRRVNWSNLSHISEIVVNHISQS